MKALCGCAEISMDLAKVASCQVLLPGRLREKIYKPYDPGRSLCHCKSTTRRLKPKTGSQTHDIHAAAITASMALPPVLQDASCRSWQLADDRLLQRALLPGSQSANLSSRLSM